ncbi:hypothetical protein K523DRAFT_358275 [Schizophyllum commune Tattone D]|nr:hypothetical protein K523DRAFT_358275 [Schizophyllum commune Tattone D]
MSCKPQSNGPPGFQRGGGAPFQLEGFQQQQQPGSMLPPPGRAPPSSDPPSAQPPSGMNNGDRAAESRAPIKSKTFSDASAWSTTATPLAAEVRPSGASRLPRDRRPLRSLRRSSVGTEATARPWAGDEWASRALLKASAPAEERDLQHAGEST